MARRALLAEGRALGRLDGAAQHVARAAQRRLLGVNAGDVEALFGVELAIVRVEPPAALRNDADAAPGAIGDFKDFASSFCAGRLPSKVTTRL